MMTWVVWLALASYARPELLVSTQWLEAHLGDADVRIVDTRPGGYPESHIPGAVWLDIDASRDAANPPTYLPDMERFVAGLEALGISNDTHVVFYDDRGGIYGTRPWVLLQLIGHPNAAILNGGWTLWTAEDRPVTSEIPRPPGGDLDVSMDHRWIATAADVLESIGERGAQLVDARTADEFHGRDLRGNPRGGAIPTASHLFWEETLDSDGQRLKSPAELEALFERYGLDAKREIITYCQGGGRAAHELFVLYLMGYDRLRLYLGSMEDWSRQPDLPLR